jgi:hypothetical protein
MWNSERRNPRTNLVSLRHAEIDPGRRNKLTPTAAKSPEQK